jgi:AhpD family alkylhydroperoxidase
MLARGESIHPRKPRTDRPWPSHPARQQTATRWSLMPHGSIAGPARPPDRLPTPAVSQQKTRQKARMTGEVMKARIQNPALTIPGAFKALQLLADSVHDAEIPKVTHYLVHLRASQINGCGVCVDIHSRELEHAGEPSARIFTVSAWREAPYFNDAERAALALTEATTRLADHPDPVPDEIWDEAAHHYSEPQLAVSGARIVFGSGPVGSLFDCQSFHSSLLTMWRALGEGQPTRSIADPADVVAVQVGEQDEVDVGRRQAFCAPPDGISEKIPTQTLRSLERDGFVARRSDTATVPQVWYLLTPLGRSVLEPLAAVRSWAHQNVDGIEDPA